ncbi:MAG: GNAT family N-acetyltransferase [Verrucomicrobiota bacterium]
MFAYDLELLSDVHDRKGFRCGSESLERYLRETAKGHLAKGVSITRVMVERNARNPKPILGYFTLTSTLAKAAVWPGAAKGLPPLPVPIVLLGRLAVAEDWQGHGIARLLLAAAREIASASMRGAGGVGLVVDPASEELVTFYEKYGFRRVEQGTLRMFLPLDSLC